VVSGEEIEQGDLLEACPVFLPPEDLAGGTLEAATFLWEDRDVVIMSQTCDLAVGREKVTEVLLCPIWLRSELTEGFLATSKGMEEARRGNLPGFQVLAACSLSGFERDVRVVDFRRVYSLPVKFVRRQASTTERIRLLPPYREHLAQAFARFFMRVGLPVDVPPFK
jgi:hypothetical protein